jgi:hypothetical protein
MGSLVFAGERGVHPLVMGLAKTAVRVSETRLG